MPMAMPAGRRRRLFARRSGRAGGGGAQALPGIRRPALDTQHSTAHGHTPPWCCMPRQPRPAARAAQAWRLLPPARTLYTPPSRRSTGAVWLRSCCASAPPPPATPDTRHSSAPQPLADPSGRVAIAFMLLPPASILMAHLPLAPWLLTSTTTTTAHARLALHHARPPGHGRVGCPPHAPPHVPSFPRCVRRRACALPPCSWKCRPAQPRQAITHCSALLVPRPLVSYRAHPSPPPTSKPAPTCIPAAP